MLSLPYLQDESPLYAEYSISGFILSPGNELSSMLGSDPFMSGLGYEQAADLLLQELAQRVEDMVFPVIRKFIEGTRFGFLDMFSDEGSVSDDFRRQELHGYVKGLLARRGARPRLNSAYQLFCRNYVERYLCEIRSRDDAIYGSLASFDGKTTDFDETAVIYRVLVLAVNCYTQRPEVRVGGGCADAAPADTIRGIPSAVMDIAADAVRGGHLSEGEPLPSDFLRILNARFTNAGYIEKTGGCMMPDISWFTTAMASGIKYFNMKLLGLMLEIAQEKNW